MTFGVLSKVLYLLDHDKEVGIRQCDDEDDDSGYCSISISKYDEISSYLEYFTESGYRFFELDSDHYIVKEIREDI